ncbi:MAG: HEAT repeat domain-containing protein [Planctomycetes bacterium]|nr:HEAT repeat domain-containing protein [Planctomycetota bacterium]
MGRPENYAVKAVDPNGRAVPVLDAGPTMGGQEGPQEIPAKGTWARRLFLPRWVKLTQIADYTINCKTTLKISKATGGNWNPNEKTTNVVVETRTQLTVVPSDDARMGSPIEALGTKMLDAGSDISDEVVRYLTAIEDERVIPFFNEAASSNNYGLRFAAMNALAKFRSDDALQGIKKGMTTQAPDMMANAASEEVAGQLADNLRHSAAVALSNSPHPKARSLLLSMWKDPYYGVRIDVLHALGKMDTPESLQMLRKMADDANKLVRNEALRYIDLRSRRQE